MTAKTQLTPYAQAWRDYQATASYQKLIALMKQDAPNEGDVYLVNRIKEAFDAGWTARGERIKAIAEQFAHVLSSEVKDA